MSPFERAWSEWQPFEQEAVDALRNDLEPYLEGVGLAMVAVERGLQALDGKPVRAVSMAQQVCAALLAKLANDLRSCGLLGCAGYQTQCVNIVAGALETGFTIAYVGADEARAGAWASHNSPTKQFKPMKSLIRAVLQENGDGDVTEREKHHYRTYSQCCLAKHGNPLFLQQHAFQAEGHELVAAVGPSTSREALRAIQFALFQVIGVAHLAISSFADRYGVEDTHLRDFLSQMTKVWDDLRSRGLEKWGDADPFPGQW